MNNEELTKIAPYREFYINALVNVLGLRGPAISETQRYSIAKSFDVHTLERCTTAEDYHEAFRKKFAYYGQNDITPVPNANVMANVSSEPVPVRSRSSSSLAGVSRGVSPGVPISLPHNLSAVSSQNRMPPFPSSFSSAVASSYDSLPAMPPTQFDASQSPSLDDALFTIFSNNSDLPHGSMENSSPSPQQLHRQQQQQEQQQHYFQRPQDQEPPLPPQAASSPPFLWTDSTVFDSNVFEPRNDINFPYQRHSSLDSSIEIPLQNFTDNASRGGL